MYILYTCHSIIQLVINDNILHGITVILCLFSWPAWSKFFFLHSLLTSSMIVHLSISSPLISLLRLSSVLYLITDSPVLSIMLLPPALHFLSLSLFALHPLFVLYSLPLTRVCNLTEIKIFESVIKKHVISSIKCHFQSLTVHQVNNTAEVYRRFLIYLLM